MSTSGSEDETIKEDLLENGGRRALTKANEV